MPKKKKQKNRKFNKIMVIIYALCVSSFVFLIALQSGSLPSSASSVKLSGDNKATVSEQKKESIKPVYSFEIISKTQSPKVYINQKATIVLKVKNTGNTSWFARGNNAFFLGTSRQIDRKTLFYNKNNRGWYSGNRIMLDREIVKPGKTANFIFEITAPNKSGIYREFFAPVIENVKWLGDPEVYWDIEVRDPDNENEKLGVTMNGGPVKYIDVKLQEQMLYAYENGIVKYRFQTSTGMDGMNTPEGKFQIYNKYDVAYSKPYNLYMDNWMAISGDGAYGIHSLPYWLLAGGQKLYEGEEHLGTRVSHGCIRLSQENSKKIYDWAEVGTPVFVED
mgnify:CR=1 FL=1